MKGKYIVLIAIILFCSQVAYAGSLKAGSVYFWPINEKEKSSEWHVPYNLLLPYFEIEIKKLPHLSIDFNTIGIGAGLKNSFLWCSDNKCLGLSSGIIAGYIFFYFYAGSTFEFKISDKYSIALDYNLSIFPYGMNNFAASFKFNY